MDKFFCKGRYKINEFIDRGSEGLVYLVEDTQCKNEL